VNHLSKRLDRIEERIEQEEEECLHFPCPDGTFIKAPGCRSLVDVVAKMQLYGLRLNDHGNQQETTT
jgi:hypothetical protein